MTVASEAPRRVVYLLGAGASHGCVDFVNSRHRLLTSDLGRDLQDGLQSLVEDKYGGSDGLRALANNVVDETTDYEHLITFLDQSPSDLHRRLAADVRDLFEGVLRKRIKDVEDEQGRTPDDLYYGLIDLHLVKGLGEELRGFLTLNYDDFLEHAIERSSQHRLDPAVVLAKAPDATHTVTVIKLHGSFGWRGGWPINADGALTTVWIPPGIQKVKERYPFNLLWGRARELLDCDILRLIGCNLGAKDWDLISLLFTTCHGREHADPYDVEVIDAPSTALELQRQFPYLNVRSILEVDEIGPNLIAEYGGPAGVTFDKLSDNEKSDVLRTAGTERNWFWIWLKQKAEAVYTDVGSVETPLGAIARLLEAH